jgi:hypothetical protein
MQGLRRLLDGKQAGKRPLRGHNNPWGQLLFAAIHHSVYLLKSLLWRALGLQLRPLRILSAILLGSKRAGASLPRGRRFLTHAPPPPPPVG